MITNITNPSNSGIKEPDMEWETTGQNVWPPATNGNPQSPIIQHDEITTLLNQ